jgi:hypothetical protein
MDLYTLAQNNISQLTKKSHVKNVDLDITFPNEKLNLMKN